MEGSIGGPGSGALDEGVGVGVGVGAIALQGVEEGEWAWWVVVMVCWW